jgi:hypothetical protein
MSFLKGNYHVDEPEATPAADAPADQPLEQEYYKAALSKLGGSIAFVMKGRTFLWDGDATSGVKGDPTPKK